MFRWVTYAILSFGATSALIIITLLGFQTGNFFCQTFHCTQPLFSNELRWDFVWMTDSRRWRPGHSTKRCLLPTVQSESRNIWINFSDNFILIQCLVELQRFWIIDGRITDHLCLIKLRLQMVRSQVVYHLELPGPFVVFACRKPFYMCLGLFTGPPVFLELTCDIFMLICRVFLIKMAIFVFQMVVQITHSSCFWLLCSLLLVVFRNFFFWNLCIQGIIVAPLV